MSNDVTPQSPIHEFLARRWSPYGFSDRPVTDDDLRSLFEAARWAPSSYNEQPWSYIVARRHDADAFATVLSCLVEGNQKWAQHAPVLALAVVNLRFVRNGNENRAARHDIGLASANLSFEATARGLLVHQMIGVEVARASSAYTLPQHHEAYTGLAIGYPGDPPALDPELKQRDAQRRGRKPIADFVFTDDFGRPAPWIV